MNEPRRRRIAHLGGWTLTASGAVLLVVGSRWGSGDSGYVAAAAIHAPIVWGATLVAGLLVLWSVRTAKRGRTALDVLGWTLAPVIALAVLRFGVFFPETSTPLPSPDGAHAIAAEDRSMWLEPMSALALRSGDGLLTRYVEVGCLHDFHMGQMRWLSPTRAEFELGGKPAGTIEIDAAGNVAASGFGSC